MKNHPMFKNLEVSVEILTIRGSIYECIIHAEGNVMGTKNH